MGLFRKRVRTGPTKSGSFLGRNFVYAILLGVIFLLISYNLDPRVSEVVSFLRAATHEVGFALIVASTIWVTFEFFLEMETEDHWTDRIEKISKNVFFGVFKKNFPDELIREAQRLVLDQQFVRTGLHLTYTIFDEVYQDSLGLKRPFVKLNAVARFKIRNVSNDVANFPVQIALPNPMIDEMKPFCKMNRILIKKRGAEVPILLAPAAEKFTQDLKNDDVSQVAMPVQFIPLAPNEEIEALFDYNMAKEYEDTEVFTTFYAADSVVLTVVDKGTTPRVIRARSIHRNPLDNDTSPEASGTYNFKLMEFLLPQQGFLVWWKNVPVRPDSQERGET